LIEVLGHARDVSQSVLIMSGDSVTLPVTAVVEDGDGIRLQMIPVTFRARVA
jgi:hypothetical protein